MYKCVVVRKTDRETRLQNLYLYSKWKQEVPHKQVISSTQLQHFEFHFNNICPSYTLPIIFYITGTSHNITSTGHFKMNSKLKFSIKWMQNWDTTYSLVLVYQTSCFYTVFFIPENGSRGPKHVVNKHRLSCVNCTRYSLLCSHD
jgi:hypothetical protein